MDQNQQPPLQQTPPEYQPTPGVPPVNQAPQPNPAPQSHQSALLPTGNKPALIGYYMGFLGFLPFIGLPFAIAAIILGAKGLRQHKVAPVPGGRGHALTALILGIIEVSFFTLFMLLVGLASFS